MVSYPTNLSIRRLHDTASIQPKDHSRAEAATLADVVFRLDGGRVVETPD